MLEDPGRKYNKKSPYYQSMSPYNILQQNLVFDVPVTASLEQLQVALEIDFTLNFMQKESAKTDGLASLDSALAAVQKDYLMPLDTRIGDITAPGSDDSVPMELIVSDKKRMPTGMSKERSLQKAASLLAADSMPRSAEPLAAGAIPSQELPIVQLLTARNGIETLIQSALNKLQNEYCDRSLAKIWIDFLKLYSEFFAPLPGFQSRYFTGERIDLIIRIMTRKFDGKNSAGATSKQIKTPAKEDKEDKADNEASPKEGAASLPDEPELEEGLVPPAPLGLALPEEEGELPSDPLADADLSEPPTPAPLPSSAKPAAKTPDTSAENPEHVRQKTLCEHH